MALNRIERRRRIHYRIRKHVNGTADEVHNIYGHYWVKGVAERFRRDFPDKRLFFLARSGAAGTQRYGRVFRRLAGRDGDNVQRLGAVLWFPLCQTAGDLRGCLKAGGDDGGMDAIRAKPDGQAGQGDADGTGHDFAMVVCA